MKKCVKCGKIVEPRIAVMSNKCEECVWKEVREELKKPCPF